MKYSTPTIQTTGISPRDTVCTGGFSCNPFNASSCGGIFKCNSTFKCYTKYTV